MEYWEVAYLDPYRTEDLAKDSDGERKTLLTDWTLVSRNQKSSGIVADIDSSTAVVA